jgi:hypothetical protein
METVLEASAVSQGVSADGTVDVQSVARLDLEGKSLDQVFAMLSSFLRKTELEPQWLCPANITDDPDEARFGARHGRLWPERNSSDRIAVSVCIGVSDGWIVHVD